MAISLHARTTAAALFVLFTACGRPSPPPPAARTHLPPALESLRAPAYDPTFGLAFWTERLDARAADTTWLRALDFCAGADLSRYPNCRTVRLLATASRIPGFSAPRPVEPVEPAAHTSRQATGQEPTP